MHDKRPGYYGPRVVAPNGFRTYPSKTAICTVRVYSGRPTEVHAEADANARLIAAAPEMLAALQKLEQALRKDARDKTISGDTVEYHLEGNAMYHAINSARKAIAKATGTS